MPSSIGHATSPDGTRSGFERSGDGPPLVLVHGTTADHTRWGTVLAAFEQRFTVYAVDRRGRGLSGDADSYALAREVEDVAAVVDSIGGAVDVLGHSYGALCALEAALLTTNVRRLVLYELAFPGDEPLYEEGMRERLEGMLARGERDELLAAFLLDVVGLSEADLAMMRAAPSSQGRVTAAHTVPREFADGDYVFDRRRFEHLAVPALLLTGGDSPPVLRAATAVLDAALTNSTLEVMAGQQHSAMTTTPELFSRLVLDSLTA